MTQGLWGRIVSLWRAFWLWVCRLLTWPWRRLLARLRPAPVAPVERPVAGRGTMRNDGTGSQQRTGQTGAVTGPKAAAAAADTGGARDRERNAMARAARTAADPAASVTAGITDADPRSITDTSSDAGSDDSADVETPTEVGGGGDTAAQSDADADTPKKLRRPAARADAPPRKRLAPVPRPESPYFPGWFARRAAPPAPAAVSAVATLGSFTQGSFRNEAGQRDFKLYVPAGKHADPLPLVLMLHGCKQDPSDFAAGTQMNRWADRQPVLVLYPAQGREHNGYGCWNWFNRRDQERDAGEPAVIAGMVRQLVAKGQADPRRIYAAGLSAGGAMAAILSQTYPDLLAAAGVHSGVAHRAATGAIDALGVMKRGPHRPAAGQPEDAGTGGVPMIVFHGDQDKTVNPLNGEHVVRQALGLEPKLLQAAPERVERGQVPGGRAYTKTVFANGAGKAQVEYWVVHGAGHAWSGGQSAGSFTDPLGPDASGEMLRFFLERSRP